MNACRLLLPLSLPVLINPCFAQEIPSFDTIFSKIQSNYVLPVQPGKIARKGIDAIFAGLDPFSYYLSPAEAQQFRTDIRARFGGTGMFLGMVDETITVLKAYAGNPAHKAGIRKGDQVLEIDNVSTKEKSVDEVLPMLRGLAGTKVNLLVRPAGQDGTRHVTIEREEIRISSVPYSGMIDDQVGYIKLAYMTEKCSDDLLAALRNLLKQPGLKSIVLDLRGNTGGLLSEGMRIAGFFLEKGSVLLRVKGRLEDSVYHATEEPVAPSIPMAVLTDNETASSAEVLCGALQDNDRAIIIGQKTFGKGLVGKPFSMGGGAEAVITIAFYYTPSGRCIQAIDHWPGEKPFSAGSLRQFTTKSGRLVKAQEGIMPDILMPLKMEPPILACLREKNYLFRYARDFFVSGNKAKLLEEHYAAFVETLPSGGCAYTTETEKDLHALKEIAVKEGLFQSIAPLLQQMEQKIIMEKKNALATHKASIKAMLEQEIADWHEPENGRIVASLQSDETVRKARLILRDRDGLRKMLGLDQQ